MSGSTIIRSVATWIPHASRRACQSIVHIKQGRTYRFVHSSPTLGAAAEPEGKKVASGRKKAAGSGMRSEYEGLVQRGELVADERQAETVQQLADLLDGLSKQKINQKGASVPGLFLYGSVGSGKSLLMDLFFSHARSALPSLSARRVHFHEFMLSMHQDIHRQKHSQTGSIGAVKAVGAKLAGENRLLCLDELQISDIADAAILSQLFQGMWDEGCCVVSTSNRAPSELYKDGLNRHVYMPKFEAMLQANSTIRNINAPPGIAEGKASTDYRMVGRVEEQGIYITPHSEDAKSRLVGLLGTLGGGQGVASETLQVPPGRELLVARSSGGAALFDFDELFTKALGPSDFGALASRFDTVLLLGVPSFDLTMHNEARRFMNFVDILYDEGCGLVMSAQEPPDLLLSRLEEDEDTQFLDAEHHNSDYRPDGTPSPRSVLGRGRAGDSGEVVLKVRREGGSSSSSSTTYIGDTEWSSTGRIGVSMAALSAVKDVTFAKNRAVSRLFEMRSREFLLSRPRCTELAKALGLSA